MSYKYLFYSSSYQYAEWILPVYYKMDEPKIFITSCKHTYKEIIKNQQQAYFYSNDTDIIDLYKNNSIECTILGDEDTSQFIYKYIIENKFKTLCFGHGFNYYSREKFSSPIAKESKIICYNNEGINWYIDKGVPPEQLMLLGSPKHDVFYDEN